MNAVCVETTKRRQKSLISLFSLFINNLHSFPRKTARWMQYPSNFSKSCRRCRKRLFRMKKHNMLFSSFCITYYATDANPIKSVNIFLKNRLVLQSNAIKHWFYRYSLWTKTPKSTLKTAYLHHFASTVHASSIQFHQKIAKKAKKWPKNT